ncbi:hypothetical protein HDU76_011165 [Blyttiomyces sp. JEL0837]|nr:hypothetical protein HDU76_011165 [Blyttiomyces sp. JEL0837]
MAVRRNSTSGHNHGRRSVSSFSSSSSSSSSSVAVAAAVARSSARLSTKYPKPDDVAFPNVLARIEEHFLSPFREVNYFDEPDQVDALIENLYKEARCNRVRWESGKRTVEVLNGCEELAQAFMKHVYKTKDLDLREIRENLAPPYEPFEIECCTEEVDAPSDDPRIVKRLVRATKDIPEDTIIGMYEGCTELDMEPARQNIKLIDRYLSEWKLVELNQLADCEHVVDRHVLKEAGTLPAANEMLTNVINDCRKNPLGSDSFELKPDEIPNTKFLEVKILGWSYMFVITIKRIKKHEELLIDYGLSYWQPMKLRKDDDDFVKSLIQPLHQAIPQVISILPDIAPILHDLSNNVIRNSDHLSKALSQMQGSNLADLAAKDDWSVVKSLKDSLDKVSGLLLAMVRMIGPVVKALPNGLKSTVNLEDVIAVVRILDTSAGVSTDGMVEVRRRLGGDVVDAMEKLPSLVKMLKLACKELPLTNRGKGKENVLTTANACDIGFASDCVGKHQEKVNAVVADLTMRNHDKPKDNNIQLNRSTLVTTAKSAAIISVNDFKPTLPTPFAQHNPLPSEVEQTTKAPWAEPSESISPVNAATNDLTRLDYEWIDDILPDVSLDVDRELRDRGRESDLSASAGNSNVKVDGGVNLLNRISPVREIDEKAGRLMGLIESGKDSDSLTSKFIQCSELEGTKESAITECFGLNPKKRKLDDDAIQSESPRKIPAVDSDNPPATTITLSETADSDRIMPNLPPPPPAKITPSFFQRWFASRVSATTSSPASSSNSRVPIPQRAPPAMEPSSSFSSLDEAYCGTSAVRKGFLSFIEQKKALSGEASSESGGKVSSQRSTVGGSIAGSEVGDAVYSAIEGDDGDQDELDDEDMEPLLPTRARKLRPNSIATEQGASATIATEDDGMQFDVDQESNYSDEPSAPEITELEFDGLDDTDVDKGKRSEDVESLKEIGSNDDDQDVFEDALDRLRSQTVDVEMIAADAVGKSKDILVQEVDEPVIFVNEISREHEPLRREIAQPIEIEPQREIPPLSASTTVESPPPTSIPHKKNESMETPSDSRMGNSEGRFKNRQRHFLAPSRPSTSKATFSRARRGGHLANPRTIPIPSANSGSASNRTPITQPVDNYDDDDEDDDAVVITKVVMPPKPPPESVDLTIDDDVDHITAQRTEFVTARQRLEYIQRRQQERQSIADHRSDNVESGVIVLD